MPMMPRHVPMGGQLPSLYDTPPYMGGGPEPMMPPQPQSMYQDVAPVDPSLQRIMPPQPVYGGMPGTEVAQLNPQVAQMMNPPGPLPMAQGMGPADAIPGAPGGPMMGPYGGMGGGPMMPQGPTVRSAAGVVAGDLPAMNALPGNTMTPYQSPLETTIGDTITSMQTGDRMTRPLPAYHMQRQPPPPLMGAPRYSQQAQTMFQGGVPDIEMPIPEPLTSMSPRHIAAQQQQQGVGGMPPMQARQGYGGGM